MSRLHDWSIEDLEDFLFKVDKALRQYSMSMETNIKLTELRQVLIDQINDYRLHERKLK